MALVLLHRLENLEIKPMNLGYKTSDLSTTPKLLLKFTLACYLFGYKTKGKTF